MIEMSQIFTIHTTEECEKCINCKKEYVSYPNGIYKCECGFTEDTY